MDIDPIEYSILLNRPTHCSTLMALRIRLENQRSLQLYPNNYTKCLPYSRKCLSSYFDLFLIHRRQECFSHFGRQYRPTNHAPHELISDRQWCLLCMLDCTSLLKAVFNAFTEGLPTYRQTFLMYLMHCCCKISGAPHSLAFLYHEAREAASGTYHLTLSDYTLLVANNDPTMLAVVKDEVCVMNQIELKSPQIRRIKYAAFKHARAFFSSYRVPFQPSYFRWCCNDQRKTIQTMIFSNFPIHFPMELRRLVLSYARVCIEAHEYHEPRAMCQCGGFPAHPWSRLCAYNYCQYEEHRCPLCGVHGLRIHRQICRTCAW